MKRRGNRWSAVGTLLMTAVAVAAGVPTVPRWVLGLLAGVGALAFLLGA